MDAASPPTPRKSPSKPLKLAIGVIWKPPALLVALIIGMIAANTVGWNGGAWLFGHVDGSVGLGGLVNHLPMTVGGVGCAAVLYFVARIAKWALWAFVPLMAYAALVLGTWDGFASGFDATRVEAIRHRYANAYALQHMRPAAFKSTCRDPQIELADDARALCASRHE